MAFCTVQAEMTDREFERLLKEEAAEAKEVEKRKKKKRERDEERERIKKKRKLKMQGKKGYWQDEEGKERKEGEEGEESKEKEEQDDGNEVIHSIKYTCNKKNNFSKFLSIWAI